MNAYTFYKIVKPKVWKFYMCLAGIMSSKCKEILFGIVYLVLSIFTMLHFINSSHLGDVYHRTSYDGMYTGTAWKPFVYRVLIPKLTSTVVDLTPDGVHKFVNQSVYDWMKNPRTLEIRRLIPSLVATYNKKDPFPRIVTSLIIYAMLWGYILLLFRLATVLFPEDGSIRWFAPVFGLIIISAFSRPWQYIYDIPVLFLSAACYYCILIKNYRVYIVCFLLACLNRETSIFIFIFFTLWAYKYYPTAAFVSLWVAQCIGFIVIKLILTLAYMKNAGWFLEENLFFVLNKDILGKAGFQKIVDIAVIFFLLTYKWSEKPLFLRLGLWLMPIIYVAYMMHGNPGEYRVFFDVLPLLVLLATHTLANVAGFSRVSFFHADKTRTGGEL